MVYLYCGENSFAIAQKVELVSKAFKEKFSDASLERVDGTETTPTALMGKLTSIDMLAPRKLLILTNMSKRKDTWNGLAKSLPLVPDSTEVVIIESKPDGRLSATKEIRRIARPTEFNLLKANEIERWTGEAVQRLGLEIKRDALKSLVESCEHDQWKIRHELEKLSLVTKSITNELINKYIQPNLDADIFQILELSIDQNFDELNLALDTLRQREDVNKFLGLLTSQVFALVAIKNAPKNANTSRDLGLAPFLVSKQQGLARKITDEQLVSFVANLAEVDGRIKLGEDGWLLIKLVLNQFHT